ncbi:MAG: HD domain-containing protein [Deltaproteobacteria bacterium]|nr:HD domain-containing protein [Deltaproteobacteria bacterium]
MLEAARKAAPAGSELYLVGGVLRNIALGAPLAPDYDFSFNGDTCALASAVAGILNGSSFALDEEAGVWRVVSKGPPLLTVDFTPTLGGDILVDLGQRDFTINAIALPVNHLHDYQVVIDPFGGIKDAHARVLRKVSDLVFDNDPLRMMRAVRLSTQYRLEIEKETWESLVSKASLLSSTSPERARDELVRLFSCSRASTGVSLLCDSGLMEVLVPEMKGWADVSGYGLLSHSMSVLREADKLLENISEETFPGLSDKLTEYFMRPSPVTNAALFRLAALFHDFGKAYTLTREAGKLRFIGHDTEGAKRIPEVLERLRFSRRNSAELAAIVKNHHRVFMLASLKEKTYRAKAHFFRAAGAEAGVMLLCLALVDARATRGGEDPELFQAALELLRFYYGEYLPKKPEPLMTGRQVMDTFHVPEGPEVGSILRKMNEGIESGEIRDKKDAAAFIRRWLKEKQGDTG